MLVDDYTSILPAVLREHNTEDRVIYLTVIMKGKTNVIYCSARVMAAA